MATVRYRAIAFVAALMFSMDWIARAEAEPLKIIFDHDGGIDDFVTLLLLLSRPADVKLLGITILDADCKIDLAVNTTLKILYTLGFRDVPVAASSLQGANPFPELWRWSPLRRVPYCRTVDVQPLINGMRPEELEPQRVKTPGEDFLAELLLAQPEPVTLVSTGPLSNVAHVLTRYGEAAASKIKKIYWMGGALRAHGNVVAPGHDGTAEWNAYWDPEAVGAVWRSRVPLVLVPLDATNAVPVTPDLVYRFGPQSDSRYSVLAGIIWSKVISWVYERPHEPYYAWDTLTAACVLRPGLCEVEETVETYAVTEGRSQGRTALADDADEDAGTCRPEEGAEGGSGRGGACSAAVLRGGTPPRNVSVVWRVEAEAFYAFVLEALRV
ncbi:hypothetical protein HYH03_008082 [Edaphochlamys debaryana]|uniref:Inosine/uridine-preferring nucleoside hydrolase domain-containing protein n=1 Tax=Edaphochlamys debaryana TaxID=47281 RepID=A0A835Y4A2_9CHLO|nr:hypothetical protein HYH03_008082 [Edaphochlamys debaryana]|eukprot:KAG2493866.1 hypothetical protein HYH03_008082 [Edaphochlamys debaryana]